MKGGLDCAAGYVQDGRAVALKSGRPHYEVSPEVFAASNEVLSHALELAAGYRCALQIHAESGPCADVVDMADAVGMPIGRVVKHYGSPETPLHPSLVARHGAYRSLRVSACRLRWRAILWTKIRGPALSPARNQSRGSQRNSLSPG